VVYTLLAEFHADRKVFRVVEGAKQEWQVFEDSYIPLAESYCKRMYEGEIPNAIPDSAALPAVADLNVTRQLGIRAYIGVPLVLRNGALRGAFCAASRSPRASFDDRDVRFMQVMARLVADELAYREAVRHARRVEVEEASLEALVAAIEVRDNYTIEHSREVVALACEVADRVGVPIERQTDVARVALLHDIGKLAIPDTILHHPGPLSEQQRQVMREHPALGAEIIARVPALAHLAPAVRAEHEWWDGGGYPDGLAGERIPLESRICLVCDACHAMISDRPYRRAMPAAEAREELRRHSGSMFWPEAVEALLAAL
jgi:putative nucleotidyltransferase with HDIG domain